jgi:CRISPR-associated protein Cmr1
VRMSLVELELQLETPLFAGGHDPLQLDDLWILRPSEIKGVWRWWARALVAGALYDAGELRGRSKGGMLKAPEPKEAERISRLVGVEMGLGYADPRGGLSRASSYSLVVEPVDANRISRYKRSYRGGLLTFQLGNRQVRLSLQRLSLLALGRPHGWNAGYLVPGARFRLRVEERLQARPEAVEAALLALSLALTFSGFGKGGRRGLGCLRVVRATGGYAKLFDARMEASEKVTRAINAVRKMVGIAAVESEAEELPPLPSVSARKLAGGYAVRGHTLRPFQVLEVRGADAWRLLEELHNFFLRATRARKLLGDPKAPDTLRQKLAAWVLGLPREQQRTGYTIQRRDISRRASPLLLAVHEAEREGVAHLSVFASADWPAQLSWSGSTTQQITISEKDIAEALVTAVDEFWEYAVNCGFKVSLVWP